MSDTTPAPLGEYCTRLLLLGPAGVRTPPLDAATREEMRLVWGVHGERVAGTWALHGAWLRETAAARGIRPHFRGKFFSEVMASMKREGLR